MKKYSNAFALVILVTINICFSQTQEEKTSWHVTFPTIGLIANENHAYPFLPHYFTLHELAPHRGAPHRGKNIRLAMIDTGLHSIHGAHSHSLIAGPQGIAPDVEIIMIKAFDDRGMSKKKTVIKAVQTAHKKQADILLMSLKINDTIDPQAPASRILEQELGKIPYVVAASGNGGAKNQRQFLSVPTLAYPARFATTTFSVGAFGIKGNKARIPEFSQYEVQKGPDFVLPGVDLYSAEKTLSGTSGSAALLAGCLALMLGECKNMLSHDQICEILFSSTLLLDDTPVWRRTSLHGTVDMRMALFMTRVLTIIKPRVKKFDEKFIELLAKLREILIKPAQDYADQYFNGISFDHDFMNYAQHARRHIPFQKADDATHSYAQYTLNEALDYCSQQLTGQSHPKK